MMLTNSWNEWDRLTHVVIGDASFANWPTKDTAFTQQTTSWTQSPIPNGPVPQWIIDETNQDLDGLVKILTDFGITVYRPNLKNFQEADGFYNYCPRDRLLVAGTKVVDVAMLYPSRDQEIECLQHLIDPSCMISMPRNRGMVLDAANVARLNDKWIFLQSQSGNALAAQWLQEQFPDITIEVCDAYAGVHIDSTIVPLREGVVMLNSSRVNPDNLPRSLKGWHCIWVNDCVPQDFYQYPYSSKWIGMNTLSIDPKTVIVDAKQSTLIRMLENLGFEVIPHQLRHSRTLGGGFHCVSLDLVRQS